jgi:predicted  nucleic acid-binding Zn-ribbon protein
MLGLFSDIGRWLFRRAIWFFGIAFILWLGIILKQQLSDLEALENTAEYLYRNELLLREQVTVLERQTEESANRLKSSSVAEIDKRIRNVKEEIVSKKSSLQELDSKLLKLNPSKLIDSTRLSVEIELAAQELVFLQGVRALSDGIPKQKIKCESILISHHKALREHAGLVSQLNYLDDSMGTVDQYNPWSSANKQRADLLDKIRDVAQTTYKLRDEYPRCTRFVAEMEKQIGNFKVNAAQNFNALSNLKNQREHLNEKANSHWLQPIIIEPLRKVAPVALWIVVGLVLVPIGLKSILYFVLAPLAARQCPIRLSNKASGHTVVNAPSSSVSVKLDIHPDDELLVLPEYLQTNSADCQISARLWLPSCGFLSSYAAGMHNLSEVRCSKTTAVTISAGHDSLNELTIIDVPAGSALCLRPSHLVGIIHKTSNHIEISRHWRLTSLQAWLTLQLRYLVFHGPLQLVVKGCRGVVVRDATDEGAVSQQLTMGFSANLDYGVRRTETFLAHLSGKKELLRDHFSGPQGIYIFEEVAHPNKRSGITGKGFEGFADAVLKVFGV